VRTEPLFLIAASLLHAAPFVLARIVPPQTPLLVAHSSSELRGIEVEIPIEPTLPPEAQPETPQPAPEPEEAPREQARVMPGIAPVPDARGPVEPAPGSIEPTPAPAPTASGHAPDHYDGPPDAQPGIPGIPGLGGSPIWAMPGMVPSAQPAAPAPTTPGKQREVDKDIAGLVLREGLKTKDKTLGLDLPAAGTVASAVGQAVRAGDTPAVARASFEVRLGPGGKVLGVRVTSFNDGSPDMWDRVARAVMAILAGRSLQMNDEFKKGGTVYVSVNSTVELPAGAPGGLEGAGARFDLSNIGAHASRIVRTSFRAVAAR